MQWLVFKEGNSHILSATTHKSFINTLGNKMTAILQNDVTILAAPGYFDKMCHHWILQTFNKSSNNGWLLSKHDRYLGLQT